MDLSFLIRLRLFRYHFFSLFIFVFLSLCHWLIKTDVMSIPKKRKILWKKKGMDAISWTNEQNYYRISFDQLIIIELVGNNLKLSTKCHGKADNCIDILMNRLRWYFLNAIDCVNTMIITRSSRVYVIFFSSNLRSFSIFILNFSFHSLLMVF